MMPIDVFWDDEAKTILRANFVGDWTWEDYHAANALLLKLGAEIDHRFDIIVDLSMSNGLPPGNILDNVARAQNISPPNLGINVTIQIPKRVEALRPIVKQIVGHHKYYSADTLEDAYAIIQSVRDMNTS
jgi:hypothetical protein